MVETAFKADPKKRKHDSRFRKFVITGLLTAIPILITWLVVKFILDILTGIGEPVINALAALIAPFSETVANLIIHPIIEGILAIALIVLIFYLLGVLATRVVGKQMLEVFDAQMERIPLIKTVYGGVKTLIESFKARPDGMQTVVLIDFPSPEMKTLGFLTRTLEDSDTGEKLAAVYVPTTPNPTSGYLEIVPAHKVTYTNWTVDEAMSFIVSGGAVAPVKMNYSKSAKPKTMPETE